jgi:hypothetical protein
MMNAVLRRYSTRLLTAALLGHGLLGLSRASAEDRVGLTPYRVIPMDQPVVADTAKPLPADASVPPPAVVEPAPPTSAAPPAAAVIADAAPCGEGGGPDWTKIPPITPMPRPGAFIILPSGPGYYTGLDLLRGTPSDKAPKNPYPPVSANFGLMYENDFRYLDDPNNTQHDWLDVLKRIHVGDNWLLSVGGEFRYRYMGEENSRLSGSDNGYNLLRYRAYTDVWYTDRLRLYIEFLSANSFGQKLAPLAIDRNLAEIQNLFIDYKFATIDGSGAYLRVGRQELLYGSQRLISPLDWANTRRTFQGAKAFWHGSNWDFDVFWVKPMIIDPINLDPWNERQNFTGAWATYKPKPGTAIDFYALNLSQFFPLVTGAPATAGAAAPTGAQSVYTLGSRASGDFDGRFLYDFEGMLQLGTRVNQEIRAGAATGGVGYRAKCCAWNPTFWVYYDWASGNNFAPKPNTDYSTFNQLFPFGHYYFGFIDDVGRQNIQDLNCQLSLNPMPWVMLLGQFHRFVLDSRTDALYGTSGAALRVSPTGIAGRNVGDEMDFLANFHLTRHQDILVGYSRLFTGDFIRNTAPNPAAALPAGLFYGQYTYKF